jgi:hypothetical protein
MQILFNSIASLTDQNEPSQIKVKFVPALI